MLPAAGRGQQGKGQPLLGGGEKTQPPGDAFRRFKPQRGADSLGRGAARAGGVPLGRLSDYYICRKGKCPARTLVLGYAALPPGDIPALAEALRTAWQKT